METFDVVVIGAGLAGLEITRALSGYGLSVLLADRKTALEKPVQTTGIFVRLTLGCSQPCMARVGRDRSETTWVEDHCLEHVFWAWNSNFKSA